LERITAGGPPKGSPDYVKAASVTKFRLVGNQMLIPVTLRNKDRSVQAIFLLDTGAFVSIMTPEIATRLDIDKAKIRPTTSQVIGGGLLPAGHTDIDSITVEPVTETIGTITEENFHIHIINLGGREVKFDGVLGMNFLRNYGLRIDFPTQVIIWDPL
jgi:hypothetical protein